MKYIYLVRHCEATGQGSDCELTERGKVQARELADFFNSASIERILSSPYKRAVESCKVLAEEKNIHIECDDRLKERILCEQDIPDWREKLSQSFLEGDMKLAGGESSNEASKRGYTVIKEVLASKYTNTVIVTHGNLLTLILNHLDDSYGYESWKGLTNPDVYCLRVDGGQIDIKRVWK